MKNLGERSPRHTIPGRDRLGKEEIPKQGVDNLRVIFHPLFIADSGDNGVSPHYRSRRSQLLSYYSEEFIPTSSTDASVVMLYNDQRSFLNRGPGSKGPQLATEKDVVPTMKYHTKYPENVLEAPDIVGSQYTVNDLLHNLHKRGLHVTTDTVVTVGGELLEMCVVVGISKLLTGSTISQVTLDLEATLGMCHTKPNLNIESLTKTFKRFLDTCDWYGLHVASKNGVIVIKK